MLLCSDQQSDGLLGHSTNAVLRDLLGNKSLYVFRHFHVPFITLVVDINSNSLLGRLATKTVNMSKLVRYV